MIKFSLRRTCYRWEENANEQGERCGYVGHDLVVCLATGVLNISWVLAVGYKLALLQKRRINVVVENATGQSLDALHPSYVVC